MTSTLIHPDGQNNAPFIPKRKPQKHKRETSPVITDSSTGHCSVALLKKRIRDTTRLLARSDALNLPATARSRNERALASYKHELAIAQKAAHERKLGDRYRMVRFFERKKAIRKLHQIQREISSRGECTTDDQESLLDAQVDVNYTLHYPNDRKYISLYKSCAGDPKSQTIKDSIKANIRQMTKEDTLGTETAYAHAVNDTQQTQRAAWVEENDEDAHGQGAQDLVSAEQDLEKSHDLKPKTKKKKPIQENPTKSGTKTSKDQRAGKKGNALLESVGVSMKYR